MRNPNYVFGCLRDFKLKGKIVRKHWKLIDPMVSRCKVTLRGYARKRKWQNSTKKFEVFFSIPTKVLPRRQKETATLSTTHEAMCIIPENLIEELTKIVNKCFYID